MTPRVSVIIPAYNARETILETLDSVIAQTYEDWEAIVSDDGSTDGTPDLISGYHPRISCIRSDSNLGPGPARNRALAAASGELAAMLDADDLWKPDYLRRQVARYEEAVAAGEKVGIVCCGVTIMGPEGPRGYYSPKPSITIAGLLRENTIYISSLVPRGLIEQLGGFSAEIVGTEDYDLWLRILESGHTVVAVSEPLAVYRLGSATVSTNAPGMARAMQTTYRHALERGRLNARERAIARRELRWQMLVELWAEGARRRARTGRLPLTDIIRAAPLGARVALQRPRLCLRGVHFLLTLLRGLPEAFVRRLGTS